ncbi:hypothetical protein BN1708_015460 [Verticillium longisporum]|uniref:Uncharacterized protein n=1 Tax=Verticillium longisporum TaxID=100787 RepID=A0A0G4M494_VERLO|nr:hypothetical protein BN1708_015460 [Verticillium longisporum]
MGRQSSKGISKQNCTIDESGTCSFSGIKHHLQSNGSPAPQAASSATSTELAPVVASVPPPPPPPPLALAFSRFFSRIFSHGLSLTSPSAPPAPALPPSTSLAQRTQSAWRVFHMSPFHVRQTLRPIHDSRISPSRAASAAMMVPLTWNGTVPTAMMALTALWPNWGLVEDVRRAGLGEGRREDGDVRHGARRELEQLVRRQRRQGALRGLGGGPGRREHDGRELGAVRGHGGLVLDVLLELGRVVLLVARRRAEAEVAELGNHVFRVVAEGRRQGARQGGELGAGLAHLAALEERLENVVAGLGDEHGHGRQDAVDGGDEVVLAEAVEGAQGRVRGNVVADVGGHARGEEVLVQRAEQLAGGVRQQRLEDARADGVVDHAVDKVGRLRVAVGERHGRPRQQAVQERLLVGRRRLGLVRLVVQRNVELEQELQQRVAGRVLDEDAERRKVHARRGVLDDLPRRHGEGRRHGAELFRRFVGVASVASAGRAHNEEHAQRVRRETVRQEIAQVLLKLVQRHEDQVLHGVFRFRAGGRLALLLPARRVDDKRRGAAELLRHDGGALQEQGLAAVAREAVLDEAEEVAGKGAKDVLLLRRRAQQDEPLHEPRQRLRARELELLADGLAVHALQEHVALLVGRELVELEHLVGALEVLLLLVVEHAEELPLGPPPVGARAEGVVGVVVVGVWVSVGALRGAGAVGVGIVPVVLALVVRGAAPLRLAVRLGAGVLGRFALRLALVAELLAFGARLAHCENGLAA